MRRLVAPEPDLFETDRDRDRRVLVDRLNAALPRRAARRPSVELPPITVPGLDPVTGHRRAD